MPEHKFHPERRWRFDFAAVGCQVALEIEGGVWSKGRHVNPQGFINDCIKYNSAAALGWSVIRVTPQQFEQEFEYVVSWLSGCIGEFGDV